MTKSKIQNPKKTIIAPKSKSNKIKRVRKSKTNRINNKNKTKKSNMKSITKANKINIDNTGQTELIYKEGNKSPKKTVFKWDGNYDGNNANIHMNLDVDGKQTKSDIKLSNEDIMELLSQNTINKSLDQRLDDDFNNTMFQNQPPVYTGEMPGEMYMPTAMHIDTPMPLQMTMSRHLSRPIIISDMQMSATEPLFIENDMIRPIQQVMNIKKSSINKGTKNTKKHKKTHK
jgi:hypothetical protein